MLTPSRTPVSMPTLSLKDHKNSFPAQTAVANSIDKLSSAINPKRFATLCFSCALLTCVPQVCQKKRKTFDMSKQRMVNEAKQLLKSAKPPCLPCLRCGVLNSSLSLICSAGGAGGSGKSGVRTLLRCCARCLSLIAWFRRRERRSQSGDWIAHDCKRSEPRSAVR